MDKNFNALFSFKAKGMIGFKILPIFPSQGANNSLLVGRIAIPSPTIFSAKASSGTLSIDITFPLIGAIKSNVAVF